MKPFRTFAALSAALLLALTLGCSDQTPTSAPPPADLSLISDLTNTVGGLTGTVTDAAGQLLPPVKGLLACNVTESYSTTQAVGPNGGTIRVGPHSLVIPPYALSETTKITATAPAGQIVEVEFQPHGLKFAKKTTLTMSYRDCGILRGVLPQIVYADDERNVVEQLISLIDVFRRTVSAKTDHFSSYILAEN